MRQYRVVWEIDIWADTPREAAETARKFQLDPCSTATHFRVEYADGPIAGISNVDLREKD